MAINWSAFDILGGRDVFGDVLRGFLYEEYISVVFICF